MIGAKAYAGGDSRLLSCFAGCLKAGAVPDRRPIDRRQCVELAILMPMPGRKFGGKRVAKTIRLECE
jgi:hypothetical protein